MGHSLGTGRFIASLRDSGPFGVRVQGDCITASAIALPFRLSSAPGIGATISTSSYENWLPSHSSAPEHGAAISPRRNQRVLREPVVRPQSLERPSRR